jgi:hypothetical protein
MNYVPTTFLGHLHISWVILPYDYLAENICLLISLSYLESIIASIPS